MTIARLLACSAAALGLAGHAAAQCGPVQAYSGCDDMVRSRTMSNVQTAALNAAVGGATAGVLRVARGGRFGGAFVRGAAGGALTYAGKQVVAQRFAGAGLLGREVAAVGTSISYNAAAGVPALRRLVLPLGPVRFYLRPGDPSPVQVRVDAATAGVFTYTLLREDNRLDLGASFSAGAPVFRRYGAPGDVGWEGAQVAGVVHVRHAPAERNGIALTPQVQAYLDDVAAHERVHVVQYDQTFLLWSAPAEDAILGRSRVGRALRRRVDLGLSLAFWAALNAAVPHDSRPWEREAYLLSRSTPDDIGSRPDGR
jgi:hypothetical protein